MNGIHLTPVQLLAAMGVVLVVLWAWRASAKRAKAASAAARSSARLLSLTGRVAVGAGLIAGVQWLAFTYPGAHWALRTAVLVVPALLSSYVLTRSLTVTTVDVRRGGRR